MANPELRKKVADAFVKAGNNQTELAKLKARLLTLLNKGKK